MWGINCGHKKTHIHPNDGRPRSAFFAVSFYFGPVAPGVKLGLFTCSGFHSRVFWRTNCWRLLRTRRRNPSRNNVWTSWHGRSVRLIGLPLGKALSGLTSGLIGRGLRLGGEKQRSSILGIPASFLAYLRRLFSPSEYFIVLQTDVTVGSTIYLSFILPKALVELTIISVIIAALMGNNGFCAFTRIFTNRKCQRKTITLDNRTLEKE